MAFGGADGPIPPSHFSVFITSGYQQLTQYWLSVTVLYFDVFLGILPLVGLVFVFPKIEKRATNLQVRAPSNLIPAWKVWNLWTDTSHEYQVPSMNDIMTTFANGIVKVIGAKPLPQNKIPVFRPRYLHSWMFFTGLKMCAWVTVIGLFGDLAFSVGWKDPRSWSGLYFDLVWARANGLPNGAHLVSYIGVAIFGIIVMGKFRDKGKGIASQMFGDIFQGATAAAFLGSLHEGIWLIPRFLVYGPGPLLSEQIRDASFAVMCVLLIVTFWKFPGRKIQMKVFLWPTVAYCVFLVAWTFIPIAWGMGMLPITSINNPTLANNVYQETRWFPNPYVNFTEITGWLILWVWFSIKVIRLRR